MQLHALEGNRQRLDGGAMFGNCPRPVWERWAAPDERNRIELACRCLLVTEASGRRVLFETGIGNYMAPELRDRFGVTEADHRLLAELAQLGVSADSIDVIVLSHLHFDHAGGLLEGHDPGRSLPRLAFPRAQYVVGTRAWARAQKPHARDRASFIPGLCELLEASPGLELVGDDKALPPNQAATSSVLGDGYQLYFSEGHTPGLMLARVETPIGPINFMGDLIPGTPWVHLPITMGYDRAPECLIDEKQVFLDRMRAAGEWLFYTHDPSTALSRVELDERGRYRACDPRSGLAEKLAEKPAEKPAESRS